MSHPFSPSAEQVEGRGPAKGNSLRGTRDRTQCRDPLHAALERIRQAAGRDKELRLTALWHHVYNVDRLRREYYALTRSIIEAVLKNRRDPDPMDARLATLSLFGTLNWLYRWYDPSSDRSPKFLANQIFTQFLSGALGASPSQ